ncbi:DUF6191 domain-containing protein [Streptomyces sp. B6B3]|uniref:DUF6191 domain-containing protein n=1 Tax=Streptomyces sp. B6B3 TaxID=3153570 RepID=UPI00325F11F6
MLNPFSLIEALFHPSAEHREEERRRLEHGRVDDDSQDPGSGPVDLDSGRVVILVSSPSPPERA